MEMLLNNPIVTDEMKEACAIEAMRSMLQRYSQDNNMTFEDALLAFANSTTYQALFDFETAVWKEGSDYLRCLFEKAHP